jgi:hypothetical protein
VLNFSFIVGSGTGTRLRKIAGALMTAAHVIFVAAPYAFAGFVILPFVIIALPVIDRRRKEREFLRWVDKTCADNREKLGISRDGRRA